MVLSIPDVIPIPKPGPLEAVDEVLFFIQKNNIYQCFFKNIF